MRPKIFYFIMFFLLLILAIESSSCTVKEKENDCAPKIPKEVSAYYFAFKEKVKEDLQDKVPQEFVEKVLCSKDVEFRPELMLRSLTWKEAVLPYHQFLEPERLDRAYYFLCKNYKLLKEIEEKFSVDKEVIVGIMLVETDLGRKTGKHPVLNTFLSLALAGNETLFLNYLPSNGEIDFSNSTIKQRYQRRAEWAYKELLYALQYLYQQNLDPKELKGSIFGAFGYPQFVPKSYFIYGYDWDGDGKVNLFNYPDSLASIANYLAKEGYRKSLSEENKMIVIMKYNKSEPYAQTILQIAGELKKRWEEKSDCGEDYN